MKEILYASIGGLGGAGLTLVTALFFEQPPSRGEFVKVKTTQELIVDEVREIKHDVKELLRRVR